MAAFFRPSCDAIKARVVVIATSVAVVVVVVIIASYQAIKSSEYQAIKLANTEA